MTDFLIARDGTQWGLVLRDGDLVMTEDEGRLAEVTQRVVYRLMTWSTESVYDTTAGMPFEEIFGSDEIDGISALFHQEVLDTEGVDEVTEFDSELVEGRTLKITFAIRVGAAVSDPIVLETSA